MTLLLNFKLSEIATWGEFLGFYPDEGGGGGGGGISRKVGFYFR